MITKLDNHTAEVQFAMKKKNRVNLTKEVCTLFLWWLKPRLLLVDFYYNFECDWFIELSNNNLASEIVENRSFLNQSWYITKTEFFSCFIIHFFNNVPKRTPFWIEKVWERKTDKRLGSWADSEIGHDKCSSPAAENGLSCELHMLLNFDWMLLANHIFHSISPMCNKWQFFHEPHVGYYLAITNLIPNKHKWNSCFIKFH